jgi:hypothetical protein
MINPSLSELHETLVNQVQNLSQAMNNCADPAAVNSLAMEIAEVNHRVTVVGNLLLTQQSEEIDSQMGPIHEAVAAVQTALQDIQGLVNLLNAVTSLLTLVDKVVDAAKLVLLRHEPPRRALHHTANHPHDSQGSSCKPAVHTSTD